MLSVLLFEGNEHRTSYKQYFLPTVEIKDCNVMTDGKNFFDERVKNNLEHMIVFKNCSRSRR